MLSSVDEIRAARTELARRGLDYSRRERWRSLLPVRALRRSGLVRPPFLPDPSKAWDVLLAIELIARSVRKDAPILDVGCKDSELLPCLAALGFTSLDGIDMDPSVVQQPTFGRVCWRIADFYQNGFAQASFGAICAISTIEHGLRKNHMIREVSRLLRPGGLFVFSTDYHNEKIDTSSCDVFGMEWTIFSRREIECLLRTFEEHGMLPVGEVLLDNETAPIRWGGHEYTFLFGALKKEAAGGAGS